VANWLFAQTTHVAVRKLKFVRRVAYSVAVCSSIYQVLLKSVPWFCRSGWSKIAHPHYFVHWLIQQLYYRTSRDVKTTNVQYKQYTEQ